MNTYARLIVVAGMVAIPCLVAPQANAGTLQVSAPARTQLERMIEAPRRLYLDGEIDSAAPERVESVLRQIKGEHVWVYLNSPGGSLLAGMNLGRIIRKYATATIVGAQNPADPLKSLPGNCYSACALAYLGGPFRLDRGDSRYGVHRAFKTTAPDSSDLDLGQVISAATGIYIREMGADPALFDLIASAGPDQIYVLSKKEQEELKVVNNGRMSPEWTIEAVEGGMYLRGLQNTIYGIGKAMFICNKQSILFWSVYEAGRRSAEIAEGGWVHSLYVDGDTIPLPEPQPMFDKEGSLNALFPLTRTHVQRILTAKQVGHSMQLSYDAPTFVGYHVEVDTGSAEKVHNFLKNCLKDFSG